MAMKDKGAGNALSMLRSLMKSGGLSRNRSNQQHQQGSNEQQNSHPDSIQALIVPTQDAHNSEYIAPCDARRVFLSSFTGSAGTAVILLKKAALFTDGRYHLQAEGELDKAFWTLMKQGRPETPTISEFLNRTLSSGSRVGVDPFTMTFDLWTKMEKELRMCGNELVPTPRNLVDEVWTNRPARPMEPVLPLAINFAGKPWNEKVVELREKMEKKGAKVLILTALDDVAWLFNLRGSDIKFNPVFFAYAAITSSRSL